MNGLNSPQGVRLRHMGDKERENSRYLRVILGTFFITESAVFDSSCPDRQRTFTAHSMGVMSLATRLNWVLHYYI